MESTKIRNLFDELIESPFCTFPIKKGVRVSTKQGVYIIYSPKNDVLFIARTQGSKKGLNQTLNNHLNNQSSFAMEFLNSYGRVLRADYRFKYIEINDPRTRALIEALAIGVLCPLYIGIVK